MGRFGLDSTAYRWGPVAGCCEQSNRPLGPIKGREFVVIS